MKIVQSSGPDLQRPISRLENLLLSSNSSWIVADSLSLSPRDSRVINRVSMKMEKDGSNTTNFRTMLGAFDIDGCLQKALVEYDKPHCGLFGCL